jgi:hypothetical protein
MDFDNKLKPKQLPIENAFEKLSTMKPEEQEYYDRMAVLSDAGIMVKPSKYGMTAEYFNEDGSSAFTTQLTPEMAIVFEEGIKLGIKPNEILKKYNEFLKKNKPANSRFKETRTRLSYNPDGSVATGNKPEGE